MNRTNQWGGTAKTISISNLSEQLPIVLQTLQQLHDKQFSFAPHITLYDGSFGIENLFDDLVRSTMEQWFGIVKVIASNTLDTISLSPSRLHDFAQKSFDKLQKNKVTIELFLANGITIMDELLHSSDINNLITLPAGYSSINLYLVGHSLYIVIFEDTPYGIKIHSKVLATLLHFLIDKLDVK